MTISRVLRRVRKNYLLYLLLLPVVAYYVIFHYVPIGGLLIAFMDYMPSRGIFQSEWVGFKVFAQLFSGHDFRMILKNTVVISLLQIIFGFPAPILLSLLINEVKNKLFKRTVQTVVYMPHFLSWIIAASIVKTLVDSDGVVTRALYAMGLCQDTSLLFSKSAFYPILVTSAIWKEVGWGTLIYMAAIAGIPQELYESAVIDGASRFQQTLHVTLPSIASTIIVLLILRLGSVLSAGFEQIQLLKNSMVRAVGEILDTYVYEIGFLNGKYSLSTATGLFKSIVSMALVLCVNSLARRFGDSSLL